MIKFLKKRWYLVVGFVLVILLISSNINKSQQQKQSSQEQYKIKRETLKDILSLSGEIDAEEKVTLKFQTSGRLAWVGVREGDYVKKYQTIASLDQRDLKNRLSKYLNTYAKQRNSFEETRDDSWNQQYALSESLRNEAKRLLENNQYDLNNAVLDVEYQNLSVEYANLWTPIEGIVTHVSSPYAGVNITPTSAEFEIINPKTIYFSVTAEQTDIINLKEGMKGEISLDAYPDKKYQGEVYYISYSPKEGETGTVYELRLKLEEEIKELSLRLKMTGDIDFLLKKKSDVLAIPVSYVKKDRQGNYVLIGDKNKQKKQYIKIADEIDGKYVITSGLTENTQVYD